MAPPTPFHIIRHHSHPIHQVAFSSSSSPRYLYTGDEQGTVSIIDLGKRRVVASWKANEGGVLGVGEWDGGLISHGRDNLLHFHEPLETASQSTSAVLTPLLPPPKIKRSLDVNALNFCKFSICQIGRSKGKDRKSEQEGLIAVPNLIDSETVDIYSLPSLTRLHAAVCHQSKLQRRPESDNPTAPPRSGLIMAIHLYFTQIRPSTNDGDPTPSTSKRTKLRLLVAFEDGRVESWECYAKNGSEQGEEEEEEEEEEIWKRPTDGRMEVAQGKEDINVNVEWRRIWREKVHNEAIMAMAVSPRNDYAFSVSADHQLVRYALDDNLAGDSRTRVGSTNQIGNASVQVTPDGRVVAVGGWDGCVRLFSTKTLKSLGTLPYHRQSCDTIAFPPALPGDVSARGDEEKDEVMSISWSPDEGDGEEGVAKEDRRRWMATGSKDRRVALWELKDFTRK